MILLTSPAALLLLRITLLLGVGLLAIRLLRRHGPAVQTVAGRAALAAVALLLLTAPLTRFIPPLWHVPAAPHPSAPVVTLTPSAPLPQSGEAGDLPQPLLQRGERGANPAPTVIGPDPPFGEDPAKEGGRSLAPHPSTVVGAGGLLLRLWATGTALLLLWLAVCQWQLTQLHRRAVLLTGGPALDTLAALAPCPPRLFTHPAVPGPFLAGFVRPAIYLPADHAETFSPAALRAVLAHELAHADRHDTRWTLASRLLCALLWPQPLLWLLCRCLEQVSEDACDRAVLAQSCSPRVYADCLLSLAERRPPARSQRALMQGIAPFRSQLARRIHHILAAKGDLPMPAITNHLRLSIAAATVLAALGGTLLISAAPAQVAPASWRPVSADPKSPLVGMWLFKGQPISGGLDALLIYHTDGQEEWITPGMNGHSASHEYFTYHVNGSELTAQEEDRGIVTPPVVLHFNIDNKGLTLQDAIEDSRGERVPDTAQADLVAKLLADTHAEPGVIIMRGRSALTPSTLADTDASTLAGIWIGKPNHDSAHDASFVFSPRGDFAVVAEKGSIRYYGHYTTNAHGVLLVSTVLIQLEGRIKANAHISTHSQEARQKNAVPYILSGNTLTLTPDKSGTTTLRRVSSYPEGMTIGAVAAQQAALMGTASSKDAQAAFSEDQLLAGLTPVQGPGVIVTFRDADGVAFPPNMTPANVDHAMTINALVGELKAAGAEAVTVNDQRLVATSSVRAAGSALLVNDTPISTPFVIKAIGNSKTLVAAMKQSDPRGMVAQAKSYSPIVFMALQDERLILPAYHTAGLPQYAHLAP